MIWKLAISLTILSALFALAAVFFMVVWFRPSLSRYGDDALLALAGRATLCALVTGLAAWILWP